MHNVAHSIVLMFKTPANTRFIGMAIVWCALFGVEEKDRCPNWKDGIYKPCQVGASAPKEAAAGSK